MVKGAFSLVAPKLWSRIPLHVQQSKNISKVHQCYNYPCVLAFNLKKQKGAMSHLLRPNKKNSVSRVTGQKTVGRVGRVFFFNSDTLYFNLFSTGDEV